LPLVASAGPFRNLKPRCRQRTIRRQARNQRFTDRFGWSLACRALGED
jgi:hypothetical protein